jgi:hypothetical protein
MRPAPRMTMRERRGWTSRTTKRAKMAIPTMTIAS